MGGDREFFSNQRNGFTLFQGAKEQIAPGETLLCKGSYRIPRNGIYALEFIGAACPVLELTCNGIAYQGMKSPLLHDEIPYMELTLPCGTVELNISLHNTGSTPVSGKILFRLLDDYGDILCAEEVHPFPATEDRTDPLRQAPDISDFTPGAGEAFKSVGRFGFTKGDGLLDCSMASFGVITRPFISGDPRYKKNLIWNFSLLPEGEKSTFSLNKAYAVPENESVTNDWAQVRWERKCANGKFLAYEYSLLTPAILMETDMTSIRISGLKKLGFFRKTALPLADGIHLRSTLDGREDCCYDREKDGPLTKNCVLFALNGQFPEVPLCFILRESPRRITAGRDLAGEADSLIFEFDTPVQWMMTQFPCGIQLYEEGEMTQEKILEIYTHALRQAQYALARPMACRDYYKADARQVEVIQKFSYRYFRDSFGTQPKVFAPLPPVLTLAADRIKEIVLPQKELLCGNFPTKYGFLKGVENSTWVSYILPVPDTRRDLTISACEKERLKELLEKDFDEFLHFHLDAPEVGNPGNYSFVFQYSFVLMVFHLLPEEKRKRLMEVIKEGLKKVCNPDAFYTGPGGKRCYSWYNRREPLSGLTFYMTYLHVSGINRFADCEKETIENTDTLMIETDWGNAMSLYGTFLGAMFTDSWDLIEKNWPVFRHAFDYYLHIMDWACMCASYCENGISWSDGTNYGGYLGFLNMAELLGKEEDLALGRYAFAKMFAMRCALFHAAQDYYSPLMKVPPWYCAKFFHEETDASRAFLSYPSKLIHHNFRSESLYNITTEGHYLEVLKAYTDFMKENVNTVLENFEQSFRTPPWGERPAEMEDVYHSNPNGLQGWQEVYSYFVLQILLKKESVPSLKEKIELAMKNKRLAREFLGHVQWSKRRVPGAWTYSYLLTLLYGWEEDHLTIWKDLTLQEAAYPELVIEVTGQNPMLEIRRKGKGKILLNGKELTPHETQIPGLIRLYPPESGTIRFEGE